MKNKRVQQDLSKRERFSLTPLAIPMLAGPGSISLLIAYRQQHTSMQEIIAILTAIFSIGLVTFLILRTSFFIVKFMGASGLNAVSRIIGFIVIAIGIEYISVSVVEVLKL